MTRVCRLVESIRKKTRSTERKRYKTKDEEMMDELTKLGNAARTAEIVRQNDFTFQKKYGQNFLIDEHVLGKIIDAAEVTKDDYVLEIGPGIGTMTQLLCERAWHVTAIEIDKDLIPILHQTMEEFENFSLIHGDVMKTDLRDILERESAGHSVKVVANLPYYITTPILMRLFEEHLPLTSVTVMVQKEVAERMQCGPGTKNYGALSLAVQYYAQPYIAANVPPNCFMPRPKVGSCVIRLTLHTESPVTVRDESQMFSLIRAAFNQRRKTLTNAIANFEGLSYTKEDVLAALHKMGLSETIRGEALTLEQFAQLSDCLQMD